MATTEAKETYREEADCLTVTVQRDYGESRSPARWPLVNVQRKMNDWGQYVPAGDLTIRSCEIDKLIDALRRARRHAKEVLDG